MKLLQNKMLATVMFAVVFAAATLKAVLLDKFFPKTKKRLRHYK